MITLKNVSKVYKKELGEVEVLKNINLNFKEGKITGIIGQSGAGKSTLLRCINFLEKPTSGEVIVDNKDLSKLKIQDLRELRKKIGMIFQHFNLMKNRTVYENIRYPLEGSKVSKKEIEDKIEELLELVDLKEKKNAYPSELSGGQKQRVAIARALANSPKLLLSDEATSALDPETTSSVLGLLKKINEKLKVTIVLITHQMEVIKEICDEIVILENGEIKENGNLIDVFSNSHSELIKKYLFSDFYKKLKNYLLDVKIQEDEKLLKLIYVGEAIQEAYISKISTLYNVEASILFGNIEIIQNTFLGYLLIKLKGEKDSIKYSIKYLAKNKIKIEVIDLC